MPYAVVARYRCEPRDIGVIRDALLAARRHTLQEPGNLLYIVHADTSDKTVFTLYEQYADEAAFEAHTRSEHFAEHIIGTVRPLLLERSVSFGDVL